MLHLAVLFLLLQPGTVSQGVYILDFYVLDTFEHHRPVI